MTESKFVFIYNVETINLGSYVFTITHKYKVIMRILINDKRSSLFFVSMSDNLKKVL
jgi:hypothetical protein